jgi:serine O-acetyltransferase
MNDLIQVIKVIRADLHRYDGATGIRGFCRTYVWEPGFRYTVWMRTVAHLRRSVLWKVPYWMARYQRHRLEIKYGISIPHTTRIGPGLFIGHCGGIVVNARATIGRNCNLSHGVTIGQTNRGEFAGCPVIGDSVFIGPGATIIGCISVGSHAAIGANAVVVKPVGNHEVVVGNPARMISTKGSTGYIDWQFDE